MTIQKPPHVLILSCLANNVTPYSLATDTSTKLQHSTGIYLYSQSIHINFHTSSEPDRLLWGGAVRYYKHLLGGALIISN